MRREQSGVREGCALTGSFLPIAAAGVIGYRFQRYTPCAHEAEYIITHWDLSSTRYEPTHRVHRPQAS